LRQAESEDNAKNEDNGPARAFDGHTLLNGDVEEGEIDEDEDVEFNEQAAPRSDGTTRPVGSTSVRPSIHFRSAKLVHVQVDSSAAPQKQKDPRLTGKNTADPSGNLVYPWLLGLKLMAGANYLLHLLISAIDLMEQDQIVENMKMAYWWAGYYSGLYEAKQSANQGVEQ
jgi:hypothetical protein